MATNCTDAHEDLPGWLDREVWEAFVEMRAAKGKRAPFTSKAKKMLLAKLTAMRNEGHNPNACLMESVINGWSGVFPLKSTQENQKTASHHDGAWHQSRSGIEAMGERLGLGRWNQAAYETGTGEQWPAYAARVKRKASAEGVQ